VSWRWLRSLSALATAGDAGGVRSLNLSFMFFALSAVLLRFGGLQVVLSSFNDRELAVRKENSPIIIESE
jgi:hypothetical protein